MKRLKKEVSLDGKFEVITLSDLRRLPGEIMQCVELGKTYLITRNGKAIAVLSKPPGETLTIAAGTDGTISYKL